MSIFVVLIVFEVTYTAINGCKDRDGRAGCSHVVGTEVCIDGADGIHNGHDQRGGVLYRQHCAPTLGS